MHPAFGTTPVSQGTLISKDRFEIFGGVILFSARKR